jgi:hypothetical protein
MDVVVKKNALHLTSLPLTYISRASNIQRMSSRELIYRYLSALEHFFQEQSLGVGTIGFAA